MNRKSKLLLGAVLIVVALLAISGYWYTTYLAPITVLTADSVLIEVGGGYSSPHFEYPITRNLLKLSLTVVNDGCRLGELTDYPYSTLRIRFYEPQVGADSMMIGDFTHAGSFVTTIPYDNKPPYRSSDGTIDGFFIVFTEGSNACMGFPVTISYTLVAQGNMKWQVKDKTCQPNNA